MSISKKSQPQTQLYKKRYLYFQETTNHVTQVYCNGTFLYPFQVPGLTYQIVFISRSKIHIDTEYSVPRYTGFTKKIDSSNLSKQWKCVPICLTNAKIEIKSCKSPKMGQIMIFQPPSTHIHFFFHYSLKLLPP